MQLGDGRLGSVADGKTMNMEMQGDMGWTFFKGRQASSNIEFEEIEMGRSI